MLKVFVFLSCHTKQVKICSITKPDVLLNYSDIDSFITENTDSLRAYAKNWTNKKYWSFYQIDRNISKNIIFAQLNRVSEIEQLFENIEAGQKRSVKIDHYMTEPEYVNETIKIIQTCNFGAFEICKAYLNEKENIIQINIGFGTGFSGWGFNIYIKDRKFNSFPCYFDDIISSSEIEPLNFSMHQKLILNKENFVISDSIYGYIKFSSVYYNEYGYPSKHNVSGYFRTKIQTDRRNN